MILKSDYSTKVAIGTSKLTMDVSWSRNFSKNANNDRFLETCSQKDRETHFWAILFKHPSPIPLVPIPQLLLKK